jgi:hypothetical protein
MLYRLIRIAPFLRCLRGAALLAGAAALLIAQTPGAALAQPAGRAPESLVKAAFLHKFASFVEWPQGAFERPDSPLKIGVLGSEPLWQELSELARDRDRDGRPVVVTRLKDGDALTGHHILYIKASTARMPELLQRVPDGVLTVADSDGAHPRGSVISFFLEEGRVGFGISLDAAARQHLRLSPRLLAVARSIQGLGLRPNRFAMRQGAASS